MKKIMVLFFIILGLVASPIFVLAQTVNSAEVDQLNKQIADKKDLIKQLEDTIAKYNNNIAQAELEGQSLKNQLSILDDHIAKAQTDIELTQEKIKQAQLQIAALQLTITDKESAMEKQKAIITKMVQDINADKRKNYLEVLLSNQSFAQFYDQLQYTTSVYSDLGQSLKVLRVIKEDLQTKQDQIAQTKKTYEDLKAQLENKKAALQAQSAAKQQLLITTQGKESKYKTLSASLKQQYQSVVTEELNYENQLKKKLSQENKLNTDVGALLWPVPSHIINAYFHDADYPFKNVFQHSGIDIKASQGTPVQAAASGYVAQAKLCYTASCYSYVLIVHTGTISTLYGHLSRVDVRADQFVQKGDVIGLSGGRPGSVGAGPFVTGSHLHFEVRVNGIPVDPLGYIQP